MLICSIVGIIGCLLSFSYPILVLNIISKNVRRLNGKLFRRKFGSLYSYTLFRKFSYRQKLAHFYIILFLGRRFIYAFLILFLFKTPNIQMGINIFIHLFIFVWNLKTKPYGNTLIGIIIYIFDGICLLIFSILLVFLLENLSDQHRQLFGRIIICIIIATVTLSWGFILVMNVIYVMRYIKRKKEKERKRRNTPLISLYIRRQKPKPMQRRKPRIKSSCSVVEV